MKVIFGESLFSKKVPDYFFAIIFSFKQMDKSIQHRRIIGTRYFYYNNNYK